MPGPQRGRADGSTPRPQAEPEGAPAGLRRPTGRAPTTSPQRPPAASGAPRARKIITDMGTASAPRLGRLGLQGGFPAPAGALRIAKGNALGSGSRWGWRSGWVGAAHATGICALVRNISQAWGSNPPAWSIFKGWGTPSRQGPDQRMSLRFGQWPSCFTTPATSLSCPHSPSRRSPRPSRRQAPGQPVCDWIGWGRRNSGWPAVK